MRMTVGFAPYFLFYPLISPNVLRRKSLLLCLSNGSFTNILIIFLYKTFYTNLADSVE